MDLTICSDKLLVESSALECEMSDIHSVAVKGKECHSSAQTIKK